MLPRNMRVVYNPLMNKLLAVSALGPDGPAVVQDRASLDPMEYQVTRHAATEPVEATEGALPYAVDLLSLDQPGIVFRLVRFLTQRKVRITELSTATYVESRKSITNSATHPNQTPRIMMRWTHIELGKTI